MFTTLNRRVLVPGSLAVAIALAGCSSASSPSPGFSPASGSPKTSTSATQTATSSVPFPVAAGNTWRYRVVALGAVGTAITKMVKVSPSPAGGQAVTMRTMSRLSGQQVTKTARYVFGSDGSIAFPLGGLGNGVTVKQDVTWPPASVIASGQPTASTVKVTITAGRAMTLTAHVVVRGLGAASVTVPAGTYHATAVVVTVAMKVGHARVVVREKTWLASGVGPVKVQVMLTEGGTTRVVALESLKSFKQG